MTSHGSRLDDRLGTLAVGKVANVVVLSGDPMRVEAAEIGDIKVDAVLFEGRVVSGCL